MPKYSDQVRETSDTTGVGASIHLTGAVAPWGTFAGAFATGDQIEYAIADGAANSETAWGVYDASANTLTRLIPSFQKLSYLRERIPALRYRRF